MDLFRVLDSEHTHMCAHAHTDSGGNSNQLNSTTILHILVPWEAEDKSDDPKLNPLTKPQKRRSEAGSPRMVSSGREMSRPDPTLPATPGEQQLAGPLRGGSPAGLNLAD